MRKNLFTLFAIFQIFLLVNFYVAESYSINLEKEKINSEINIFSKKLIKSSLRFFTSFLSIKEIGMVSADGLPNCCLKVRSDEGGDFCRDIDSSEAEICEEGELASSTCEEVDECDEGCCFDSSEGLCSKSPKKTCEAGGGVWSNDDTCASVSLCTRGCCVLGDDLKFVTDTRCNVLSSELGITKDFRRELLTEDACLSLSMEDSDGACVLSDGTCKRMLKTQCNHVGGIHYLGNLCSHPDLVAGYIDDTYSKQASVGCAEGFDEIYWFDSWGNRENIYDADAIKSWNDGKILAKGASCSLKLTDEDSLETCGNCNHFLSSVCSSTPGDTKIRDGDYVCESLTCVDKWGNTRQNQETWCDYDNKIYNATNSAYSTDTVGSTHWLMGCDQGTIKSLNCGDYRNNICAEIPIKEGDFSYSVGACVLNEADLCISYNSNGEDMEEQCNENPQCHIQGVDISPTFSFSECVPKYPTGVDFDNEKAVDFCDMADVTCEVWYEDDIYGDPQCVRNCDCREQTFAAQMNNLCVSLGDCGGYINWIGDGSPGKAISGRVAPTIVSWQSYLTDLVHTQGEYAINIWENTSAKSGENRFGYFPEQFDLIEEMHINKDLHGLAGAIGSLWGINSILSSSGLPSLGAGQLGASSWMIFKAIGTYAGCIIAGMQLGQWLSGWNTAYGVSVEITRHYVAAGALAGAATAAILYNGAAWGPYGLIAAAIVIIILKVTGVGSLSNEKVTFDCEPWKQPSGGQNCAKCNENPLKPCTEYRCESLGAGCELINGGLVQNPECVWTNRNDASPPVISKTDKISADYLFLGVEANQKAKIEKIVEEDEAGAEDKCVNPFDRVQFNLSTNEYAICKWGLTSLTYEEMEDSATGARYALNHSFEFTFTSIDALTSIAEGLEGAAVKELYGNMTLYVKCEDKNGIKTSNPFKVNFCVRSGPDKTAVSTNGFIPPSGGRLKFGETSKDITMWINKPATCKYDYAAGKTYDEMSFSMSCPVATEITPPGINGWNCSASLADLTGEENDIFFKCKNNPWNINSDGTDLLDKNGNSLRFENVEDISYSLRKSISNLSINYISPVGDVLVASGSDTYPVPLQIVTTGGGEGNGISNCQYQYNWGDYADDKWYDFLISTTPLHEKEVRLVDGSYDIPVRCSDAAENIVEDRFNFDLEIDNIAPEIATIYKEGSLLFVTTYEASNCFYDTTSSTCDVPIKDASTNMENNLAEPQKIHSVEWDLEKTYNIQCKDMRGNLGNCLTIAPSEV